MFSVEATFVEPCGIGTAGIDLRLDSLIATNDGETVAAPRHVLRGQKAQRRRQRALAWCLRGSRRRVKPRARLAARSGRIARRRRNHLHKLARSLVPHYQGLAFEDVDMAGLQREMLTRSFHDAAWLLLVQLKTYNAESAGSDLRLVDLRGASQTCPACGTIEAKTLLERRRNCPGGTNLDRTSHRRETCFASNCIGPVQVVA